MPKESFINTIETPFTEKDSVLDLAPCVREPLPSIQSYCQSKTFIANFGINDLVACASGLFCLLTKLKQLSLSTDPHQLKTDLIHEIKAFECAALHRGYTEEKIMLARYAICATLDENILQTDWGFNLNWHEDTLLYTFQGEISGGERLFTMLEHLGKEQDEPDIDLLEFIYLCMSLGFEGKYRKNPEDKESFYHILDKTYHMIKKIRGDIPEKLSHFRIKAISPAAQQKKSFWLNKLLLIACSCLIIVYGLFFYSVNQSITPVLHHIEHIHQHMLD